MSKGKSLLEQLGDKADGLLAHPHVQAAGRAGKGLGLADPVAEPAPLAKGELGAGKPGVIDRLLSHPVVHAGARMRGSVQPALGLAEEPAEAEGLEASL